MNLIDELLKADIKAVSELKREIFKSKRLGLILGKDNVDVEIQEIPARRLNDIVSYQVTNSGNIDFSKSFDAKLMLITEGVVNPDLRDKKLQEHFGVMTAKDLAEKLFASEINSLSDQITNLSGIDTDDSTIKN